MKTVKVKAEISVLEAKGWINVRMRGDHRIFRKDGEPRPIPVTGLAKTGYPRTLG